jgi:hypothetical protein
LVVVEKPKRKQRTKTIKLDVACGQNKQEGFVGIDIAGEADIVHDLNAYPWPLEDGSVNEVFCSHYLEHIPHYRPEFNGVDGWFMFFNELQRVCRKDAKLTFVCPYSRNDRAFWDPTHTRYIHETTFYYLDKAWRESQKLDHYAAECDFEVVVISSDGIETGIASRHHEAQDFARRHYFNVLGDLIVELKRK